MSLITRVRQQSLAWLVFFVTVADLIGFGIVIPILPFLSPQLGGTTDDIAFILVTQALLRRSSRRYGGGLMVGRRSILGLCLFCGRSLILFCHCR